VLRDLTERVIVASKGRFDRARTAKQRAAQGLPHVTTLLPEDFLALTVDVWSIPPESARRVGHPAPFPVELPEQLIRLYTYADDLVLDPFMGSGSTLVAAARLGRRYVGYDLDPAYVDMARQRVIAEGNPTTADIPTEISDLAARKLAERELTEAGFVITGRDVKVPGGGVSIDIDAVDKTGRRWLFEVAGSFTSQRGGLSRTDTVWRQLGRAAAIGGRVPGVPIVMLTTRLPRRRSEGDLALRAAGPAVIHDVVDLLDPEALGRLAAYAGRRVKPLGGYWTDADLSR
jgi:site-specific DNA-methyltransferase (adenine-specific)